jgi:hypothetical protein
VIVSTGMQSVTLGQYKHMGFHDGRAAAHLSQT